MNFQRLLFAGTTLCFAAALSGCGGNSTEGNSSSGSNTSSSNSASTTSSGQGATSLSGIGASFPALIYTRWFDDYKTAKGVQIDYQPAGSGAGIKALTKQTVDFGASDAPLGKSDKLPAPAVTLPTVAGAVALAYNLPGAPKNLKMPSAALADVFLGKITKWNDPVIGAANPGAKLPDTPITVAHRSDGSGTTYILTNYLAAISSDWKSKVGPGSKTVTWPTTGLAGKGSDGVASLVKGTPGALGYVELAYAKKGNMPYLSVQNKAGQFVEPTVEATTAAAENSSAALLADVTAPIVNAPGAKSYPISGFTYIMAYQSAKNANKGAALKDFLKWAMTDGQKAAKALDYAPLPKAVADANIKTIDSLK